MPRYRHMGYDRVKRVRLKTVLAGPAGTKQPGEHEFEDDVARDLIAGGYAEELPEPEPEVESIDEAADRLDAEDAAEAAATEPAETASQPETKTRRRRTAPA